MNKGEQQGPPLWWPRHVLYPRTWPTRAHCGAFQILKEKFPRPDAAGTVSSGTPRAMRHSYGRHHAAIQRGFPRCCKKRACPNPTGREVRVPLQSGAGGPEAQCCGGGGLRLGVERAPQFPSPFVRTTSNSHELLTFGHKHVEFA